MRRLKRKISTALLVAAISMSNCVFYTGEYEVSAAQEDITSERTVHHKKASTIASGQCGDNVEWSIDSNYKLILSGTGNTWDWEGLDDSDYAPWYSYHDSIKEVVIGDGITGLGNGLFYKCTKLKHAELPASVKYLGAYIFSNCTALEEIVIPSSVSKIGEQAFWECVKLTSVNIPGNLVSIGSGAFCYCVNIETVSFKGSLETISDKCFFGCVNLRNVTWPKNLKKIETQAFYCCYNLRSALLPDGLTSISAAAFSMDPKDDENMKLYATQYSPSMTKVKLPDTVTEIGSEAFKDGSALTSLTISSGLSEISQKAFSGCSALPEITLSKAVDYVGYESFANCQGLQTLYVDNKDTVFDSSAFSGAGSGNTVVTGRNHSTAQTLADEKNWEFVYIQEVQKITTGASSYKKTYGSSKFSLNAKTNGDGKLSYSSNNKNVATVTTKGTVTIKNYGTATITVKAASTKKYKSASKKVTITVVPKKAVIKSISKNSSKSIRLKWSVASSVTGYQIVASRKKDFSGSNLSKYFSRKKSGNIVIGLPKGKTYYIHVRAYKTVNGKKYYGAWSNTKRIRL